LEKLLDVSCHRNAMYQVSEVRCECVCFYYVFTPENKKYRKGNSMNNNGSGVVDKSGFCFCEAIVECVNVGLMYCSYLKKHVIHSFFCLNL
jgi:hypothetical protein